MRNLSSNESGLLLEHTFDSPGSLLNLSRHMVVGVLSRHAVRELSGTGLLSGEEAQSMFDAGLKMTGPVPRLVTPALPPRQAASTGQFANIIDWIETNLPQLLQTFVTALPLILEILAAFGAE